jgi:hypothetical protein
MLPAHLPPVEQTLPAATQVTSCGSQQPEPQPPPRQQACPGPPHCTQTSLAQASPDPEQAPPGQHGWPAPPHCWHTPGSPQAKPLAVQVCPAQHGWPAPPQATHCTPEQAAPPAVHRARAGFAVSGQHICPTEPQLPQLELAQVPPTVGQVVPEPTHTSRTQQPLPEQAPPAQQG